MTFKRFAYSAIVAIVCGAGLRAQSDQADRIREAATVFREIMRAPDSPIPGSVLGQAEGIAIFPSTLKGGFIFGGHRGKGILSVRDRATGMWSTPAFLTLTEGSFGAQIGGQAVDVVLVIVNRRGLEQLLQNQFEIGAGAAVTGSAGRGPRCSLYEGRGRVNSEAGVIEEQARQLQPLKDGENLLRRAAGNPSSEEQL